VGKADQKSIRGIDFPPNGRKPKMLACIALANKMARQVWAMLVKSEDYRDPALATTA